MKKLFYKLIGYKPWRIVKVSSKYGEGYQILSNFLWIFTKAYDDDGFIWYFQDHKAKYAYTTFDGVNRAFQKLTRLKMKPNKFTYKELE